MANDPLFWIYPTPMGGSVNGYIDRQLFDGKKSSLKFPTVDDTVADIKWTKDAQIFKVDVDRAFQNLRVDLADRIKFGIKWQNDYNINTTIAFG